MTDTILRFTEAALEHIQQKIAQKENAVGFRLAIKETGCTGYMYIPGIIDAVNELDVHEQVQGIDVYVATDAIDAVKGTQIDYVDISLGQKQLAFDNPNADSLCGCGESFNLRDSKDAKDAEDQ